MGVRLASEVGVFAGAFVGACVAAFAGAFAGAFVDACVAAFAGAGVPAFAGAFSGAFAGAGVPVFAGAFPGAGVSAFAGAGVGAFENSVQNGLVPCAFSGVGSRSREALVSNSIPRNLFIFSLMILVASIASRIHTIAARRHWICQT